MQIWEAKTGQVLIDAQHNKLEVLASEGAYSYDGTGEWLSTMSSDEKWLVSAPTKKGVSLFRNSSPSQGVARFSLTKLRELPYRRPVNFAFSPDGNTLVIRACDDQKAYLDFYDTHTWKLKETKDECQIPSRRVWYPQHQHHMLQWSRNGRFLLSWWYWDRGSSHESKGLALWRTSDRKKLASSQSQASRGEAAFSNAHYDVQNDGRILTWGEPSPDIHLSQGQNFNFKTKPLLSLSKEAICVATLSLDCSTLVAGTRSGRVYTQRLK